MLLYHLRIYYSWKNIKKSYKSNKFKISAPRQNKKFALPDESYSVSDTQDYFKYIIQKHDTVTDNPPIRIYVNTIENRVTFSIKTGYFLNLLTPETIKLLGSSKSKITKGRNGENLSHLEVAEVVLIHCNSVNNNYWQDLRVLYRFVPRKLFGQLLDISPTNFIFLKISN